MKLELEGHESDGARRVLLRRELALKRMVLYRAVLLAIQRWRMRSRPSCAGPGGGQDLDRAKFLKIIQKSQ